MLGFIYVMVSIINPSIANEIFVSGKGSDLHSLVWKIEQFIIDHADKIGVRGSEHNEMDLHEKACHVLAAGLTGIYKKTSNTRDFSLNCAVRDLLQKAAYSHWESRFRYGGEGNQITDWDHALNFVSREIFEGYFVRKNNEEIKLAA